jgi:hypothetical protein
VIGEALISQQSESIEVSEAPVKVNETAAGIRIDVSKNSGEKVVTDNQPDVHNSAALDDIEMKSWSTMSSQKRSKVVSIT